MSRDTAMAEAKRLKAIMARHGVRCSIELQAGRPWSGDQWYTRKYAIMNHHTAGARTGLTPSLALVKRGRSDLPGPLANGYGGRDLIYRVITLGLANHPGQGGPITLAGVTIPRDSARPSVWGTEWEHDGISLWPAPMQEFMGRSNAALLEWQRRPVTVSIEHSTWAPRRKPDRLGYNAARGQEEIRRWAGAGATPAPAPLDPLEDVMATAAERTEFAKTVAAEVGKALAPQFDVLKARAEDGLYVRAVNTRAVYQVVSGVRVWTDLDDFGDAGRPEVQDLPADHPLLQLPLIGARPPADAA